MLFYFLIYLFAPLVANFYKEPILKIVLRIQGLIIPITACYAVPSTLIQRNLMLKKAFWAGLLSSVFQGLSGILLAMYGFGVWSLVISSLVHSMTYCIILLINASWRPKLQFSMNAAIKLLPFSSRFLISNLINVMFKNLVSLIIGKTYKSDMLGYYNRGYQIPVLLMTNIDGAINSVIFPVLSKYQEDHNLLVRKLRKSLQVSVYFVWPIMVGMVLVSKPLIIVLFTKKWLPSGAFLQLTAITCMLWPFSVFLHALNAIGKSGAALKLNFAAKTIEILLILLTYRMGIYIFVSSSLISILISSAMIIIYSAKIFKFSLNDIVMDLLPTLIVTLLMGILVYLMNYLFSHIIVLLIAQIIIGAVFYLSVTCLFRFPSFQILKLYFYQKFLDKSKKN